MPKNKKVTFFVTFLDFKGINGVNGINAIISSALPKGYRTANPRTSGLS